MKAENLNVLILGYGAREHALAWKIAQSPRVAHIFVAPGNAGTAAIATNVPISDEDVPQLVNFAQGNGIDLAIVGTNDPLAFGVVDAFQAVGIAIFGPQQAAARLESSKAFSKAFMRRHQIPTPLYAAFNQYDDALAYLGSLDSPRVVVKVSGLGKMGMGVTVCDNRTQAQEALKTYMVDQLLGDAAQTVIIEERIEGDEVSFFAVSDGKTAVPLTPACDHKRIYDNDTGPNTGGMGAYGPPPNLDDNFVNDVMQTIIQPTIDGMAAEGNPYVGVLFAGLMLTDQGTQVLEFNCRFGNPEALVLMSLLESDLVDVMEACIAGNLSHDDVQLRDGAAAAVMMSSPGYPAVEFPLGLPITGTGSASSMMDVELFHHGTSQENGQLVTSRGRVLAVTAVATNLPAAIRKAYTAVAKVSYTGAHYRKDIGQQLIMPTPEPMAYPIRKTPQLPIYSRLV
ncbi:MAG: phosphoribosylamine--glycine ligase [Chloroflexi bacterium]|nr:phosphoribosylamine--glycine ligase [Chloroflexota bacterium]